LKRFGILWTLCGW